MSCVALNWFKRKKEKKTEAGWTIAQYEARIQQEMNGRITMQQERDACLLREQNPVIGKVDPLEVYWNNKRPKADLKYPARPVANKSVNVDVDPRIFFTIDKLPIVTGATFDAKALNALNYVINNITYTPDKSQFTINEEWLFAYETLELRKGDCEDGAILIANLMIRAGIPKWRIRLNAGNVKGGGHAWVNYLRESDNEWYIFDWCYWPNESKNFGRTYHDAENYFSIWFSWNTEYIFPDELFERTGMKK